MNFASLHYFGSNIEKQTNQDKNEIYNPQSYQSLRENNWHYYDPTHKSTEWTHKSNAEQLIHRVPVVYVETNIVRCIGGGDINAGHPQVYIQLNTRTPGKVQTCKWCGLRYAKNLHAHGH